MAEYLTEAQRKRERRTRRRKTTVLIAGGLVLCAVAIYAIVFSPLLKTRGVEISGNQYISTTDIQNAIAIAKINSPSYRKYFGDAHFFSWTDDIPSQLILGIPTIRDITISKEYFSKKIRAEVHERARAGIWCRAIAENNSDATSTPTEFQQCFWFDDTGFVFAQSPAAEGSLILTIYDYSRANVSIGDSVLTKEQFSVARNVFSLLKELKISVREIKITKIELHELNVATYDGPELRFSLDFDPLSLKEPIQKIKNTTGFKNMQYVDLRVENRIYYK